MRSFLDNFEWDINVCNMNNIDSNHVDLIIIHLRCLCDFSLLRFEEDEGFFKVFYYMDYGRLASDKGTSICEKSVLSFDSRVLILHRKKHSIRQYDR